MGQTAVIFVDRPSSPESATVLELGMRDLARDR
jgi:hypothetical protein